MKYVQIGLMLRVISFFCSSHLRRNGPSLGRESGEGSTGAWLTHTYISRLPQVGVFRVLLELVAVAPDAVGAHAKELTPGVQAALAVGGRGEVRVGTFFILAR